MTGDLEGEDTVERTGDPTSEFIGELLVGDLLGEDKGELLVGDFAGEDIGELLRGEGIGERSDAEDLLLGDLTGEATEEFQDKFIGDGRGGGEFGGEFQDKFIGDGGGGGEFGGEDCGDDLMLTGDDRIGDLSGDLSEARIGDKFNRL